MLMILFCFLNIENWNKKYSYLTSKDIIKVILKVSLNNIYYIHRFLLLETAFDNI